MSPNQLRPVGVAHNVICIAANTTLLGVFEAERAAAGVTDSQHSSFASAVSIGMSI